MLRFNPKFKANGWVKKGNMNGIGRLWVGSWSRVWPCLKLPIQLSDFGSPLRRTFQAIFLTQRGYFLWSERGRIQHGCLRGKERRSAPINAFIIWALICQQVGFLPLLIRLLYMVKTRIFGQIFLGKLVILEWISVRWTIWKSCMLDLSWPLQLPPFRWPLMDLLRSYWLCLWTRRLISRWNVIWKLRVSGSRLCKRWKLLLNRPGCKHLNMLDRCRRAMMALDWVRWVFREILWWILRCMNESSVRHCRWYVGRCKRIFWRRIKHRIPVFFLRNLLWRWWGMCRRILLSTMFETIIRCLFLGIISRRQERIPLPRRPLL